MCLQDSEEIVCTQYKMSFNLSEYKVEGEVMYKGTRYLEPLFGPSTIPQVEQWRADPKDIIIATYPKTGSTWMTQILSDLMNDGVPTTVNTPGDFKIPYLEFALPSKPPPNLEFHPCLDIIKAREPPRGMKTHLGYDLIRHIVEEDKAKIILMFRNPKDTLVSYYHHYKAMSIHGCFQGTFHDFFELFKAKLLVSGDLFEWYQGWWEHRHLSNIHVVKYEDLNKEPQKTIQALAQFIGKDLSPEVIKNIVEQTAFSKMQENFFKNRELPDPGLKKFFRKGKVGDWKNHLNQEESDYIDMRCKEVLEPLGLTFDYE